MTQDYSRKNWVDRQYRDWMQTTPAKAVWNNVLKKYPAAAEFSGLPSPQMAPEVRRYLQQSEFKKTNTDESFPEMEDNWNVPPWLGGGQEFDNPGPPTLPFDPPEPTESIFFLNCFNEFCVDQVEVITISGSHPIYGIELIFPNPGDELVYVSGYGTNTVTAALLIADPGYGTARANIRGYMTTYQNINGEANKIIYERDPDDCVSCTPAVYNYSSVTTLVSSYAATYKPYPGSGPPPSVGWPIVQAGGYSITYRFPSTPPSEVGIVAYFSVITSGTPATPGYYQTYSIARTWLEFDLSGRADPFPTGTYFTMSSDGGIYLFPPTYSPSAITLSLREATTSSNPPALTAGEWNSIGSVDLITPTAMPGAAGEVNIQFNTDGLAYLNANLGGTVKFWIVCPSEFGSDPIVPPIVYVPFSYWTERNNVFNSGSPRFQIIC